MKLYNVVELKVERKTLGNQDSGLIGVDIIQTYKEYSDAEVCRDLYAKLAKNKHSNNIFHYQIIVTDLTD